VATTATFSNYVYASGNPPGGSDLSTAVGTFIPMSVTGATVPSLSVQVSAVVVSSTNGIVAATGAGLPQITVPFNYGDSADEIRDAATDAVRAAAGDYSLEVIFVA
jgi:hypothetical protein